MSAKQDRQGVRTPAALEQKYDFGSIAEATKTLAKQSAEMNRLGQDIAQYKNVTDKAFSDLEASVEQRAAEIETQATEAMKTANNAATVANSAAAVAAEARDGLAGKVSTSDIVDDLATNNAGKVLSANQGVALKGLLDDIAAAVAALEERVAALEE